MICAALLLASKLPYPAPPAYSTCHGLFPPLMTAQRENSPSSGSTALNIGN